MKDTQFQIGKIITSGERDAVHIAVLPLEAHKALKPGEHIGVDGSKSVSDNFVGIVDPFVEAVKKGEMFYMFLYPNTIISLRHQWTHPLIPDDLKAASLKAASEAWLREFIARSDCPEYEIVIAAASGEHVEAFEDYGPNAYRNDGDTLFFWGRDAHSDIPPEFWDHIEVVTGKKVPQGKRAQSFSCSC